MNQEVFIIHAREDEPVAANIVEFLESHGIGGWIRSRDFPAAEESKAAIFSALAAARIFIVIFSAAANDSRWAQTEVQRALDSGKLILPLRLGSAAPMGSMQLLLKRRYSIDANAAPFEQHLEEILRIIKPFANQRPGRMEAQSISRTLPARKAILSGSSAQVAREPMGPFQAAIQCPHVAEAEAPLLIELIVANQGGQLLELVEVGLKSETLDEVRREVIPDLAPGTQARLAFEIVPRHKGMCLLHFSFQGYDNLTKYAYHGTQAFRVSSGEKTLAGTRAQSLSPSHEAFEVTRGTMTFARPDEAARPPSITLPEGFEPLDITMDYAHSLDAESVAKTRLDLSIPFAYWAQAPAGTLLTLERMDGPGAMPYQDIRLSARPTFGLGRSREESDFLLWFWPRNEIHDTKTLRISKKQCTLSLEDGECVIRNSGASSLATFEEIDLDERRVVLKNRGVLNLSGNYLLEIERVPPSDPAPIEISNLVHWKGRADDSTSSVNGCVKFRPASAHVLPQHAVWLLSEGTFGTSQANAIVFDLPELAEIQGRFHYFGGCFWIENGVDNGAVSVDNHELKPRSIVPVIDGKILKLGGVRFLPRVAA